MKAVQVNKFGSLENINVTDIDTPELKENQVLVKVYAASLNPFDVKLYSGIAKIPMNFPYTPGGDFAGVVKEVGEGVLDFRVGDEIFGSALILNGGSGSFAEIVAARIKNIAKKPSNLDFLEAASLPLVGASAIQALEEHIQLKPNQKILIQGGAGGIGSIAIQLAKHLGAYVATTVSTDDTDFAKSLGADQVIDYKSEKFEDILKDFDAVFDTVGGQTLDRSFKVLRKDGSLISMAGEPSEELSKQYQVKTVRQGTNTNKEHLERLAELVEKGAIKPQVDRVFPLNEVKQAFEYLEKDSPKGKVVLKMNN